jgi:hypothetical protein
MNQIIEAQNRLEDYYLAVNKPNHIAEMMVALKMPTELATSVSLEEFMQIMQVRIYDLKVVAGYK